jgi:hypothetical protein
MPNRRVVGVLGRPGRAEVDEHGAVWSADGAWRLEWMVADVTGSWRSVARHVGRHQAIDGTPVFETALRVTGGDVRQRVWRSSTRTGSRSSKSRTTRPSRSRSRSRCGTRPFGRLRSPGAGSRGPGRRSRRRSRLPDPSPGRGGSGCPCSERSNVASARADRGASVGRMASARGTWRTARGARWPARRFSLASAACSLGVGGARRAASRHGARWRLARQTVDMPVEVIAAPAQRLPIEPLGAGPARVRALVEAHPPRRGRGAPGIGRRRACSIAARATLRCRGRRRSRARRGRTVVPRIGCRGRERSVELLREWPAEWVGAASLPIRSRTRWGEVSFAVRWHGERPALLWECEAPVTLCAPSLDAAWQSRNQRGEALLSGVSAT